MVTRFCGGGEGDCWDACFHGFWDRMCIENRDAKSRNVRKDIDDIYMVYH